MVIKLESRKIENKYKILFIYSNMGDGGTQRQRSILSKKLQKSFDLSMGIFENIQLYKFHGKIIDLKAPTTKKFFKLVFNILKRIYMINKLTKAGHYDLLFSSSVIANSVCLLAKKLFRIRIPLIITFNNSLASKSSDMGITGKISQYLNLKLISEANLIVSNAKKLEEELHDIGFPKKKLTTIYNGIDFEDMGKKSEEEIEVKFKHLFCDKVIKVMSIGRLTTQKDYGMLIKAFAKVRERINARLIILGEGEKRSELEKIAKENGVKKDVHLIGWVNNPYSFLKQSDLFVLSSLWEGFPNVIIEALGCGVPVISTDCPTGPNEIITNEKNGILIPIHNWEAMADSIIRVLSDKKLYKRIQAAGRKRAEYFDIKKISSQYVEVINKVI